MPRPTAFPRRRSTAALPIPSGQPPVRETARRVPRAMAAVALLGVAAAGCGGTDPFAPVATFVTSDTTFVVYPISSAPASLPTAIGLYTLQSVRPAVRVGLGINFDLAIDLDAAGNVRLLPPKRILAVQAGGSLVTGVQAVTGTTYAALLRAPNTGYEYDSATVVAPGQLVVVQTQGAATSAVACATTTPMYAKLVVDSVRPSRDVPGTQAIYIRARVDPNCGFRSLDTGIPKN